MRSDLPLNFWGGSDLPKFVMRYLIALLWLIIFTKKLFFWVYLWQLKEYHIGRFRDHFRTYKGKRLILSWRLLLKVLILFGIYFSAELIWLITSLLLKLEKMNFRLIRVNTVIFAPIKSSAKPGSN